MKRKRPRYAAVRAWVALGWLSLAWSAGAHELQAASQAAVHPSWDVLHARVTTEGRQLVFHMHTRGPAGRELPAPSGRFGGSEVVSYVWPTSLDPAAVGFEEKAGILAFAVTSHPDFDDTPLFDENGDGKVDNDGARWHSHWVVLVRDDACGKDALKVKDIPEGRTPPLPPTWPGVPLLIDSPGYAPVFDGGSLTVRVPMARLGDWQGARFDAVTAALRVNANLHAPMLCVRQVFKVASGDLSLPGRISPAAPR
ncbi:hypothetical protein [Eleftheria terrae]|uniref:hypothetical protein n=1 Tax=Eleftheria terrae TaxID=1597781 RepID=UPI00263B0BE0|nr:hypothetical protein [Eleftheria terrae]WKB54752.1 hypothetical protein N7L95_10365 [Eleftheria terrae]